MVWGFLFFVGEAHATTSMVRSTCIRKGSKAGLRVSDDLIYVKDRLKAAWILYRTVARALPTDDVCRNDGERYGVPRFCGQSPRYDFPSCRVGGLQVGLTVFALSLALSHGEREQMAENHNNS